MLLTKKELRRILANFRVRVPAEVEKKLLDEYGHLVTDDEGHVFEYTKQDIYEQLRKRLCPYQSSQRQMLDELCPSVTLSMSQQDLTPRWAIPD